MISLFDKKVEKHFFPKLIMVRGMPNPYLRSGDWPCCCWPNLEAGSLSIVAATAAWVMLPYTMLLPATSPPTPPSPETQKLKQAICPWEFLATVVYFESRWRGKTWQWFTGWSPGRRSDAVGEHNIWGTLQADCGKAGNARSNDLLTVMLLIPAIWDCS